MIVLVCILLDFIANCLTSGWYTYFTMIAMMHLLFKDHGDLLDVFNLAWIGVGLLGLCALDVAKYGRSGISWGIIFMVFCLFYVMRHYVLSSQRTLLIVISLFVVLIDVFCVRMVLLGLPINGAMTVRFFFGTITSLSLAFLGVRGSRS